MVAENGDIITVEYEGSFDDGTVFDSSAKHGKALEFILGQKQVVPGFEKAVVGMEKGEEKSVKISAKDAYGERSDELVQKVPLSQLPPGLNANKGMILGLRTPDGLEFPAQVIDVTDSELTLDLNHPLAGKTLNFKIKIVEIKK